MGLAATGLTAPGRLTTLGTSALRRNGTLAASGGGGPITLVAHTVASSVGGADLTTSGINTTGSSLIVMAATWFGSAAGGAAPTDSNSNTWLTTTVHQVTTDTAVQIYYVKNPTVGAGHTFTTHFGAGFFPAVAVATFNNTNTGANVDQQAGATGGGVTTLAPGSVTPLSNNEVVVSALGWNSASSPISIGSSFVITDTAAWSSGNAMGVSLAYLVQTTAAAVNPTWTANAAMTECVATIVTHT